MEPGEWALQALDMIESEIRAVVHSETPLAPNSETDIELASLIQKTGATSIAEIEKIIGALQEAKDFLQSEGDRVQRETERYTNLTQTASASVKIISDTVAGWREAGCPLRNDGSQFALTRSPAEDNTGSMRVPDQQSPPLQGRGRSRGNEP